MFDFSNTNYEIIMNDIDLSNSNINNLNNTIFQLKLSPNQNSNTDKLKYLENFPYRER